MSIHFRPQLLNLIHQFHPDKREMLRAKSESSISLKHLECIDRISSLPGALLSRILSFLPTKNAVATSILSTRWKFVWTSITSLSFNSWQAPKTYSGETLIMKRQEFTQFVNSVLVLLNPPCIQNFYLSCYHNHCDPFYLQLWVSAAIQRTIQKLELKLRLDKPMELSLSHFNCKTLIFLKLTGGSVHFNVVASAPVCFPNLLTLNLSCITFTIANNCSVSFPSLKDLILDYVKYANEESVNKLFASCPVLESLDFKMMYCDNIRCLVITMPSLRSLTTCFSCHERDYASSVSKIQIYTPALKYLDLYDHSISEYFMLENLSSLLEAKVNFRFGPITRCCASYLLPGSDLMEKKEENISIFFGGLSNVRFLSISGDVLKAIGSISENIAPAFCNLTRLELDRNKCHHLSIVIKNLLERSDNLEHLIMKKGKFGGYHESWWMEPLSVPMCLLRRVTTIYFTTGHCSSELEMVRYFLENAEVLKLFTIDISGGFQEKFRLMQIILMIPRGSSACQVALK